AIGRMAARGAERAQRRDAHEDRLGPVPGRLHPYHAFRTLVRVVAGPFTEWTLLNRLLRRWRDFAFDDDLGFSRERQPGDRPAHYANRLAVKGARVAVFRGSRWRGAVAGGPGCRIAAEDHRHRRCLAAIPVALGDDAAVFGADDPQA